MPIVTYEQLIASRVQWENAYLVGRTINYEQYMEIFNVYVAFYADLNNQQTFNAYNSVLTKYGFTPLTGGTTPPTCPSGYHWDANVNACVANTTPTIPIIIWIAIGGISIVAGIVLFLRKRKR